MAEKKYFSDNGLTHLKEVLKARIQQTYVGETEPTNASVQVWINPEGEPIGIPTKTSDLVNDSGFVTESYVNQAISTAITDVLGGSY